MSAVGNPAAPRAAVDGVVVPRSRRAVTASILGIGLIVVVIPVATTVAVGSESYTDLRRGYPGLDIALLSTISRVGAEVGGLLTVGALITLLFLRDARGRSAKRLEAAFELSVVRAASGFWAACAAVLVLVDSLDSNGMPLDRLGQPGALANFYEGSDAPKAWTVTFVLAGVIFVASQFATLWTGLLFPLWAATFAVLAPVVVGQILVGPGHDLGSDAGIYQAIAVAVLFGAIVVAAIRVATGRLVAAESLRRLILVGAIALPVIAITEFLLAGFKLAGTPLLASPTGWQFSLRTAFLTIIGVALGCGVLRWKRARLTEKSISRILGVSALGVAGWVGTTVAMTRIPPPHYFLPTSISQILMGYDVPDAPSVVILLTQWRVNLLFLGLALAGVSVYLLAVSRLVRRGDRWPVGRTVSWVSGWIIVVVATSSGFGKYSAPDFGIHMIVHMSLNMLAPLLLALGGIVTLLLRASKPAGRGPAGLHEWVTWALQWSVLRVIYNPLLVFAVFVGSYYGLYLSGVFGEYMRFHWAHQLMNVHFLIVGYLYYSLIIGVDRPPRPLPHIGKLGYVLAAMPFHAFFGVILMSSDVIIAENFYRYLASPWADLRASQYLGGGVAWAGGEIPLMIVIVVLAVQWARQDGKEARRSDRHYDTGRDDEFDEYNRMLQSLTDRRTAGTHAGPRPKGPQE